LGDGVALCAGKSWTHMTNHLDAQTLPVSGHP